MEEKEILEIIDNPKRLRSSFFINNYPELYEIINNYTIGLDLSFKQRIWHFINKKNFYILCDCGKRVSFNRNFIHGYKKYCSPKCAQKDTETKRKRKKTLLEKYGVDNIAKLEIIKKKQEDTNYKKYGSKSSFQNKEVREKWKKTINDKYGKDHFFKTYEFKEKSKTTSIEKYGTEHFVQSEFYKSKLNEIGFSDKIREINYHKLVEKYKAYGYTFISYSNRFIKLHDQVCDHEFEIYYDVFMNRIKSNYKVCTICNNVNSGQSNKEKELIDWIKSLNIEYVEKHRKLGIELDIYLPDYKLGIEFNGLYWHSDLYKDKKYHLNKTLICENNDIRLLHIWEDDWDYNKNIVQSIILNKIKHINNRIYARKCYIKEVENSEKSMFLINNHIQGDAKSKYNIGLYYENELVSLMSFNYFNNNYKNNIELVRFCNLINYNIIGSASRLFKYFINQYAFKEIVSFSDISMFDGGLYSQLGFKYINTTNPNFWWIVKGKRHHRFTYNKKKLIKIGGDPNKTEYEIMSDMGNYRIWGCGLKKWIYKK